MSLVPYQRNPLSSLLLLGPFWSTSQLLGGFSVSTPNRIVAKSCTQGPLTPLSPICQVMEGDVTSVSTLAKALAGCSAVLSAVGGENGTFRPCNIYSTSIRALVAAMKQTGVYRMVCISAWGTVDDYRLPFLWRWLFQPTMLRNIFHDLRIMEDYLTTRDCQHILFTVVRPPYLFNIPPEGKIKETEGQLVVGQATHLSRHDLAIYMLDCLDQPYYHRKMMAVCGPDFKS